MPLEIRPDHLKIVEEILEKHLPDREVWAFGSRVNGTAKETSDLDLVVIAETPLDFQRLGSLRDDFSESNLPYKVDVVDWAKIGETFREIIRKEKVVIQKDPSQGLCGRVPHGRNLESVGREWSQTTLGSLTEWTSGGTPSKQEPSYWNGDIPWISASTMKTIRLENSELKVTASGLEHGSRSAEAGSVLLLVRGSELHKRIPIGIATRTLAFNQDVKALKARASLMPEYLLYWFLGNVETLLNKVEFTGIGAGKLDTDVLKNLPFQLPSLPEQRAIAHILGTLDDKIELNRRMNETLEAMAQALFKSWFVDFDPVRAKAEGRDTGLPKEIADLFPDGFEESELGEIPKGWKLSSVGEIVELNPSEKIKKETLAYYIDMASIPTTGSYPASPIMRSFSSGSKFRNGDTLLARITPCLENGKTAFIQLLPDHEVGWGSTEFIVLRPKDPFPKEFGYLLARNKSFREHAIQSMSGTSGRQRVQETSIAAFRIAEPSSKILKVFGNLVRQLFRAVKLHSEEVLTLTSTRENLLPKLLSGEIRVTDYMSSVDNGPVEDRYNTRL